MLGTWFWRLMVLCSRSLAKPVKKFFLYCRGRVSGNWLGARQATFGLRESYRSKPKFVMAVLKRCAKPKIISVHNLPGLSITPSPGYSRRGRPYGAGKFLANSGSGGLTSERSGTLCALMVIATLV